MSRAPTGAPPRPRVAFHGTAETELGPARTGNVFAPEVHFEGGTWRMWYGGQGADGHDRIHHAISDDGLAWRERRVVLEHRGDNLINDPSIVRVDGVYHMYYTVAHEWIADTIHHATSPDGIEWTPRGRVLGPGPAGEFDSLLVGRPSVLFEDGVFRMWFDGRRDLPAGWGQGRWPESQRSRRALGYTESRDGHVFERIASNPILRGDVGSPDVTRVGDRYVLLTESRAGTHIACSDDGLTWTDPRPFVSPSGARDDKDGHTTPFLVLEDGRPRAVYMGLAHHPMWTENSMGVAMLRGDALDPFLR